MSPFWLGLQKSWVLQGIKQLPYDPLPPLSSAIKHPGERTGNSMLAFVICRSLISSLRKRCPG